MTGRRFQGVAVPFFFRESSYERFRGMTVQENDVFLSSLVKGGTTWVHKLLFCLLHGIDNEGNNIEASKAYAGSNGQAYPEALALDEQELENFNKSPQGSPEKFSAEHFGCSQEALFGQPSPRLFSTHLYGDQFLPVQLVQGGKGRLVVVVRNLKDVLVSLHYFRGQAKDGWTGNEHGPGSLARFLDPACPNAYGSVFDWIKANEMLANKLGAKKVCVVYFEALKANLPAQIERIATFLETELTIAKRDAIARACGFDAMKQDNLGSMISRKGVIGDWKNHLSIQGWAEFDKVFEERLGSSALAQPLRHFQYWSPSGMPPPRREQTLQVDPREWGDFVRVSLENGMVVPDALISHSVAKNPDFVRPPSEINGQVLPPGSTCDDVTTFQAEANRYHLFVSGVCPWATGARVARHMMGLEEAIPMYIADGQSGAGWAFLDGAPDFVEKPLFLHSLYQQHDAHITARITVPVLWDSKTQQIVSNDSWSLVKMLTGPAFRSFATRAPQLFFPNEETMEEKHAHLNHALLNGVYRCGVNWVKANVPVAEAAKQDVLRELKSLNEELRDKPYLFGDQLSIVDIRLSMCLLRYDAAYKVAFKLGEPQDSGILIGNGYPHLKSYCQRMYTHFEPCIDWPSFRQYYRWTVGLPGNESMPPLEPIIAALK